MVWTAASLFVMVTTASCLVLALAGCSESYEREFVQAKGKCQMTALAQSPKGTYWGALSDEGLLYTEVYGACLRAKGFRMKKDTSSCSGGFDLRMIARFDNCWERA